MLLYKIKKNVKIVFWGELNRGGNPLDKKQSFSLLKSENVYLASQSFQKKQ